jgi:myo-inositol-hexaphosphate 3-phosphohydrolase
VSLVAATNRTDPVSLVFYGVNVTDRSLIKVGDIPLAEAGVDRGRGLTMYRSSLSGKYYAFVTDFGTNIVFQFELDGASGSVTGALVRFFDNGDATEGMVADDALRALYVSEEDVGVWRYGAEPEDGETRTLVDGVAVSGGHLVPNVKNLAIYHRSDGGGYLIVSSQGASNFVVYNRVDNAFLGSFQVGGGESVDDVAGQDGIEVTNVPLGQAFPEGLFVTQDHVNTDAGNGNSGNQNYKYVPWQSIAAAFDPPLQIDTAFDPRRVGAPVAP